MDRWLALQDILEQEADACSELLSLTEQERVALTQNDVQALSSIVEKKQSALNGMQALGDKRNACIADLLGSAESPQGGLGVEEIIQTAEGEIGQELKHQFAKIQDLAIQLKKATALNQTLIDTHQQYTSFCINLLTGRDEAPGTYSESGRLQEKREADPRLVDQAI